MLLFENFNEIHSICNEYGIENYTINSDGSIDVEGSVDLYDFNLTKLPLKFNKVSGIFDCSFNKLTSLEGCPKEVGLTFYCNHNQLTSLEGSPERVGISFYCHNNKLVTLEGGPKEVTNFYCHNNKLISLKGSPKEVTNFYCSNNQLTSLEGCPKKINVEFDCSFNQLTTLKGLGQFNNIKFFNNPVYNLVRLFNDIEEFKELLDDYNYIRGNKIIRARFEQACLEAGINMPKEINGYDII